MASGAVLVVLGVLAAGAALAYVAGRVTDGRAALAGRPPGAAVPGRVAVAALAISLAVLAAAAGGWTPPTGQVPLLAADGLTLLVGGVALTLGLLAAVFSLAYVAGEAGSGKYFALFLLMVSGIVGLSAAANLFTLFVFFELMAVSSYPLVAYRRGHWEPVEAGFKYLVISAIGSQLVLLGLALVFAVAGRLDLAGLARLAPELGVGVRGLAVALFLAGFGIKAAVVPLHTWLPDAHAAAPSPMSAMLSGIVIQAGLVAFLRAGTALGADGALPVGLTLALLGGLTMTWGNLVALVQRDLKRLLAYSSIAQMGYILLGVGLGLGYRVTAGLDGGLFHLLTHAFMKGLAFLCAGAFLHHLGTREIPRLRGAARQLPVAAAGLAVAGLALAGVPPLSGFMSKWLIYAAGIGLGGALGWGLAALAVGNSVLSLGYYMPLIWTLYGRPAPAGGSQAAAGGPAEPPAITVPLVVLGVITVGLGLWPQWGLSVAVPAARVLLSVVGGGG